MITARIPHEVSLIIRYWWADRYQINMPIASAPFFASVILIDEKWGLDPGSPVWCPISDGRKIYLRHCSLTGEFDDIIEFLLRLKVLFLLPYLSERCITLNAIRCGGYDTQEYREWLSKYGEEKVHT